MPERKRLGLGFTPKPLSRMPERKRFRQCLNHTHTHTHTHTGSYKAVRLNKDAREEKFQKLFCLCVDKDKVIMFSCVLVISCVKRSFRKCLVSVSKTETTTR